MKKVIFISTLIATTFGFAQVKAATKTVNCKNENSHIFLEINSKNKSVKVNQKKSKLTHELAGLDQMKILSNVSVSDVKKVMTLIGNNNDDTEMVATLVYSSEQAEARLSIQVMVDNLDGGTYSEAFECEIK